MYRVAIVEDNSDDANLLLELLQQFEQASGESFTCKVFENSIQFLDAYNKDFDLILMDIEMPGLNGMDAAQKLREKDTDVTLVFITNMAQYVLRGYTVDAVDYILKPLNYYSFFMKLKKALRNIEHRDQGMITLKTADGIFRILSSDIYYVEVQGHYLNYYTASTVYTVRSTMSIAEEKLLKYHFLRCTNSCLINPAYITSVRSTAVTINATPLPISRTRKEIFFRELANYLGGSI